MDDSGRRYYIKLKNDRLIEVSKEVYNSILQNEAGGEISGRTEQEAWASVLRQLGYKK